MSSPHGTVQAATLPGDGGHNQDAYAYGEAWAVVVDGATSFAGDRSHDPGWYAHQLAQALARGVPGAEPFPADLRGALTEAIRTVRDDHALTPATAPSATVAIARWAVQTVQVCVLGDATAALLRTDGTEDVVTDTRIDTVATEQRAAVHAHLARHGHDEHAHSLLLDLQSEEARHRNQPGGFWVASADPDAAGHATSLSTFRGGVSGLVLATDGVALDRHPDATTWRALYGEVGQHGPARALHDIHTAERDDPHGRRWPRTKVHDDKTLIAVSLHLDPASLGPGIGQDFGGGWTIDRVRAYSGVPTAEALSLDRDVYADTTTDHRRLEPQAIIAFDELVLVQHDGTWWMGSDDDGTIVCWGSYGSSLVEAIDAL